MHIDHINIKAPADLMETLKTFYCELLGLSEGFRPAFSSAGYWLYAGDRAMIHLSARNLDYTREGHRHFDHFAIRASGLPDMLARLDSMGISYNSNFIPEVDMTQLFFEDPSGTGVEVQFNGEHLE